MAYLSISKVEKSYSKEKKIIQGLDLEVEKGEFLVIVGPVAVENQHCFA